MVRGHHPPEAGRTVSPRTPASLVNEQESRPLLPTSLPGPKPATTGARRTGPVAGRRSGPAPLNPAGRSGRARSTPVGTVGCRATARRGARPMGGRGHPIGAFGRPGGAGSSAGSGSGAPLRRSGAQAPRQGRSHRFPMSRSAGRSGSPLPDDTPGGTRQPRGRRSCSTCRSFSRRRRTAPGRTH